MLKRISGLQGITIYNIVEGKSFVSFTDRWRANLAGGTSSAGGASPAKHIYRRCSTPYR